MIRRRLWFLLRTWANDTFRSPVCDHCGKRHSDAFSLNAMACSMERAWQNEQNRLEAENVTREPRRLLSV